MNRRSRGSSSTNHRSSSSSRSAKAGRRGFHSHFRECRAAHQNGHGVIAQKMNQALSREKDGARRLGITQVTAIDSAEMVFFVTDEVCPCGAMRASRSRFVR